MTSKVRLQAALNDVCESSPGELADALNSFATLVVSDGGIEVMKTEASCITYLGSKTISEFTKAERQSVRRFLMQVLSSLKRLEAASPTRTALNVDVGAGQVGEKRSGLLTTLLSASDLLQLLKLTDNQGKQRQTLLLAMLQSGSSQKTQIDLVGSLCVQLLPLSESLQTSAVNPTAATSDKPVTIKNAKHRRSRAQVADDESEDDDFSDGSIEHARATSNNKASKKKKKVATSGKKRQGVDAQFPAKPVSSASKAQVLCAANFLLTALGSTAGSTAANSNGGGGTGAERLRLTVVSFFAEIVNACWQHPNVTARKLAVKACDAWVAQGLNPSPAAAVLKKLALDGGGKGDCDGEGGGGSAAVRCASYDAIASLVQFHFSVFPVETQASLSPELFSQMFTQLAQAHYSEPRMLASVREKSLSCLQRMIALCPFRDTLFVIEAEASLSALTTSSSLKEKSHQTDLSSLPLAALSFAVALRRFVVPSCVTALPQVIAAAVVPQAPVSVATVATTISPPPLSASSSSSSSSAASGSVKRGTKARSSKGATPAVGVTSGANRLQAKVLASCLSILGDPVVPTRTNDLLDCFAVCVEGTNKNGIADEREGDCSESSSSSSSSASSSSRMQSQEVGSNTASSSSALSVLAGIIESRNSGPAALEDLAKHILWSERRSSVSASFSLGHSASLKTAAVTQAVTAALAGLGGEHLTDISSPTSSSLSNPADDWSPLRLLIGRVALPAVRDLAKKYFLLAHNDEPRQNNAAKEEGSTASNAKDCIETDEGNNGDTEDGQTAGGQANDHKSNKSEDFNAVLFCLSSTLAFAAPQPSEAGLPISHFGGLDAALARTCVLHLEKILRQPFQQSNSPILSENTDVQGTSGLRGEVEETVLRLVELLTFLLPRYPQSESLASSPLAARVKAAGVFAPPSHFEDTCILNDNSGGGDDGVPKESIEQQRIVLLACPELQAPLVRLALALPQKIGRRNSSKKSGKNPDDEGDSQRALFELVATFLEGCFDDRVISLTQPCTSVVSAFSENAHEETMGDVDVDAVPVGTLDGVHGDKSALSEGYLLEGGSLGDQPHKIMIIQKDCEPEQWQAEWQLREQTCQARMHASVCAALSALGVVCHENAAVLKKRVHEKWSSRSDNATASDDSPNRGKDTMVDDIEDANGSEGSASTEQGGGFYLGDLVRQQQRDAEVVRVLEASVSGSEGFLTCYIQLIQDLAVDTQAPITVRAAALGVVGSYCSCSPSLARDWSPRLLSCAHDPQNPSPLRAAALVVWGSIGPTISGQELEVCAFLRDVQPNSSQANSMADENMPILTSSSSVAGKRLSIVDTATTDLSLLPPTSSSSFTSSSSVSSSSVSSSSSSSSSLSSFSVVANVCSLLRIVAMRVVAKLVAGERVKGQRCLCRLAEALADSSLLVRQEALSIFETILGCAGGNKAHIGTGLLFEVAFSNEVQPTSLRHAVASALVQLLDQLGYRDNLKELAGTVSREATHKQHDALPAQILALLPPSPESLSTLHQALLRGMFRESPKAVLQGVWGHLAAASEKDSLQCTSGQQGKGCGGCGESGSGSGSKKVVDLSRGESETFDLVASSKLMLKELLRKNKHQSSDRRPKFQKHSRFDEDQENGTYQSSVIDDGNQSLDSSRSHPDSITLPQHRDGNSQTTTVADGDGSSAEDDSDSDNDFVSSLSSGSTRQKGLLQQKSKRSGKTGANNMGKALQRFKRERLEKLNTKKDD